MTISQVGLKCADQILEYNGVDLRQATAEQAAYELAKPAEKVTILVQFNLESKLDSNRTHSRNVSHLNPEINVLETNIPILYIYFRIQPDKRPTW